MQKNVNGACFSIVFAVPDGFFPGDFPAAFSAELPGIFLLLMMRDLCHATCQKSENGHMIYDKTFMYVEGWLTFYYGIGYNEIVGSLYGRSSGSETGCFRNNYNFYDAMSGYPERRFPERDKICGA
jgi:hypothetical protein